MIQQQFFQEFKTYPKTQKSAVIRQLLRIFEEDLKDETQNGNELSIEKKSAAYLRLRGALKMKNPPMTKEEVREIYYEHLTEKYK